MVDLRSDTVTRPTPGMREAIARAEVGDDALGDDPTVRSLEERVAALLGKERALFFPSGIMANETAILVLGRPGTEAVVDAEAHVLDWEDSAAAAWGGIQLRPVEAEPGRLPVDAVERAIRPDSPYLPRTSLVCVENTHNAAGGRVVPLDALRRVRRVADRHGLPVHLDGARLWNASVASGVPVADFAATADTVMVTLSKGLGCPVGSMLAGEEPAMAAAWRVRRRLGGAMRQAGLLAAAGLYALDKHLDHLADDHRRAALLAELLEGVEGARAVPPETNILMIDLLREDQDAATVVAELARRGVRIVAFSPRRLRAVTHMDVNDDDIRDAARELTTVLAAPSTQGRFG